MFVKIGRVGGTIKEVGGFQSGVSLRNVLASCGFAHRSGDAYTVNGRTVGLDAAVTEPRPDVPAIVLVSSPVKGGQSTIRVSLAGGVTREAVYQPGQHTVAQAISFAGVAVPAGAAITLDGQTVANPNAWYLNGGERNIIITPQVKGGR